MCLLFQGICCVVTCAGVYLVLLRLHLCTFACACEQCSAPGGDAAVPCLPASGAGLTKLVYIEEVYSEEVWHRQGCLPTATRKLWHAKDACNMASLTHAVTKSTMPCGIYMLIQHGPTMPAQCWCRRHNLQCFWMFQAACVPAAQASDPLLHRIRHRCHQIYLH